MAENASNVRAALSNDLGGRVGASVYPNDGLRRIGNLDAPWLEGYLGTVYADEMFVSHSEGGSGRVMYGGFEIPYEDLINKRAESFAG